MKSNRLCKLAVWFGLMFLMLGDLEGLKRGGVLAAGLFPTGLPAGQWNEFRATGYDRPVTGLIYRGDRRATSGMPLGALDTGCLDIETSGLLGYSSIFNDLSPRGGPINMPFLGISIDGTTWVMTTGQTKHYDNGQGQPPAIGPKLAMPQVRMARSIDYWGHYPILDMEFETDSPVSVSLRAWSPLLPGDTAISNTPGAFLEVHMANTSSEKQTGSLAFSFPGFQAHQTRFTPEDDPKTGLRAPPLKPGLPQPQIERRELRGNLRGMWVGDTKEMMHDKVENHTLSYVMAVLGNENVRWSGSLDADGERWRQIGTALPDIGSDEDGTTAVVDFSLEPGRQKVVRFLLVWWAPRWDGLGRPGTGGNVYTHMYASRYPDALAAARFLARQYDALLGRVIAWQEEVYNDPLLPGWLADALINNLYFVPECSFWAQAKPPIGYWCKTEDGLFALNEAPRSCPNVETLPNSACGNHPFVYFFPECILSTLRAHKAYQWKNDGRPALFFGGTSFDQGYYEVVYPVHGYQSVMNGTNYMVLLDRYWRITGDDDFFREFYDSAKAATEFAFNLRPEYGLSQIVAMPTRGTDQLYVNNDTEWFEDRPYRGYVSHAGGYRMAHAQMMKRWAKKAGDKDYVKRMNKILKAGEQALEEYLWAGDHYLEFHEPETKERMDRIFTPQLDGQYFAKAHGVPRVFPKKRVDVVLAMLRDKACKVTQFGIPPNWVSADGSGWGGMAPEGAVIGDTYEGGYLAGKYAFVLFTSHSIAMTFMYEGQKDFGLDLLRRVREVYSCKHGYTWDGVNVCSGNQDTGARVYGTEYYQNGNLWGVPAALAGQDISGPCKQGGLVDRIIAAAGGN